MSPYRSEDVEEDADVRQVDEQRRRIRVLNDNFRTTFVGGKVFITASVAALPLDLQASAILAVQKFTDFNVNTNDSYGEHDFGRIEVGGHALFWKIDYYDSQLQFGSENPADPDLTTRVLTIFLAQEY